MEDKSFHLKGSVAAYKKIKYTNQVTSNNGESKDKMENRIHNHRRPFLTLLYMGDRLVSAKQWPLSR